MRAKIDKKRTGERIGYLMKVNHYDPLRLQDALGLSCVQTIYKWLAGKSLPSLETLYSLSSLFCVNVDSLLVGNKEALYLKKINEDNDPASFE